MMLQFAYALAAIAGLLAVQAAALYVIWWLVLLVFRYIPMVGRKHRHRDWQRLNRPQR
jgi:hypothetical protein